jgi:hypothetical protein
MLFFILAGAFVVGIGRTFGQAERKLSDRNKSFKSTSNR